MAPELDHTGYADWLDLLEQRVAERLGGDHA